MAHVERIDNILYGSKQNIQVEKRGLGRAIYNKMQEFKDRIMQIDAKTGEQETYGDVHKKLIRIALGMQQRGIKANDIVLTCSYNSMDTILPIYSTLYLNAVTVSLDPSISLRDSTHLMKTVSPKLIFVIPEALDLIEKATANLEKKPRIVIMGSSQKYSTISDFLKSHSCEDVFVPDDVSNISNVCNIFFSSGTTGLPKAILHTNLSMLISCQRISEYTVSFETILYYTSFYWISAFLFTTAGILMGSKRVFDGAFTPKSFMEAVQNYQVNSTFLSPTLAMQFTGSNTKNYDTQSFRDFLCGGSTISETCVINLQKYFPNTRISIVYGQTECGGGVSLFAESTYYLFNKKLSSCGLPCTNTIIKVVDLESGRRLGPMERGEIRIKTDTLFQGYADVNSTAEDPFDTDGFLKTGDVGYYDEDNCLYICDRIKEMFKYQSWHVVPASIETIIYEHPTVLEAVVVGIPHEIDDNHPLALVILREGYHTTEEELLSFVNKRLIDREKLRAGLKIVKRFPKTPTGKIVRRMARQVVISGNLQPLMC